jgi:hypothetical protein
VLSYRWFLYLEPGSASSDDVMLSEATGPNAIVTIRGGAVGKSIHVVLAVTDNGSPPLTRYGRAVIRSGDPGTK